MKQQSAWGLGVLRRAGWSMAMTMATKVLHVEHRCWRTFFKQSGHWFGTDTTAISCGSCNKRRNQPGAGKIQRFSCRRVGAHCVVKQRPRLQSTCSDAKKWCKCGMRRFWLRSDSGETVKKTILNFRHRVTSRRYFLIFWYHSRDSPRKQTTYILNLVGVW